MVVSELLPTNVAIGTMNIFEAYNLWSSPSAVASIEYFRNVRVQSILYGTVM